MRKKHAGERLKILGAMVRPAIRAEVERLAYDRRLSASDIVREALDEYLGRRGWKAPVPTESASTEGGGAVILMRSPEDDRAPRGADPGARSANGLDSFTSGL